MALVAVTPVARSNWRLAVHAARAGTWSRERIVASIGDWVAEVGARPRMYEWSPSNASAMGLYNGNCARWEHEHPRWPSAQSVVAHFGSWSEGLEAAGFPVPRRRPPLTLGERVAIARRLCSSGMRHAEIAELLEVAQSTVSSYLVADACACGEPVIRSRSSPPRCRHCARAARVERSWDEATILAAYRAWRAEGGRRPFRPQWSPENPAARKWHAEYPRWPSAGEVAGVFARWSDMVRAAGDQPTRRRWTRDEVLAALGELAGELGRAPRSTELAGLPGMPRTSSVRALFGSWRAALAELGMSSDRARYTSEELVEAMLAADRRLGRPPRPVDLRGEHPRPGTIRARFGTWAAALRAAGIEEPRAPHRREVLRALRADACGEGLARARDQWRRPERPNLSDVVRLFGSWRAGLLAAGLTARTPGASMRRAARARRPPQRWTRELVIARMREWTHEVGRPPTRAEWSATAARAPAHLRSAVEKRQHERPRWPSAQLVQRACGSWDAAARAAGFPRDDVRPWEWPIADRIRLAHRLRADDRSVGDVAVHLGVSRWAVFRYQNASACDRCGEPALIDAGALCPRCRPPARTPAWERERALDAIRAWQREFGRPPSASEWSHADPTGAWARQHPRFPSYEQVTCLFGGWGAALQAAGTKAANVHWTPATIVAALQRWAQVNGRPPTQHDWRNRHPDRMHPSASVAANHFGSWSAALRAAGLTPATRRWTPDELVDALRAWERRHGHAPTSSEWPKAGAGSDHPARGTIVNHFGNWIQALHAAGLEPRRRADRERLLRLPGRPTAQGVPRG